MKLSRNYLPELLCSADMDRAICNPYLLGAFLFATDVRRDVGAKLALVVLVPKDFPMEFLAVRVCEAGDVIGDGHGYLLASLPATISADFTMNSVVVR